MTAAFPKVGRALLLGLVAGLAACSDAGTPLVPFPTGRRACWCTGGRRRLPAG